MRSAGSVAGAGIVDPSVDVELLAAFVLGTGRGGVQAAAIRGDRLTAQDAARLDDVVARRVTREPLAGVFGFGVRQDGKTIAFALAYEPRKTGPGWELQPKVQNVAGLQPASAISGGNAQGTPFFCACLSSSGGHCMLRAMMMQGISYEKYRFSRSFSSSSGRLSR